VAILPLTWFRLTREAGLPSATAASAVEQEVVSLYDELRVPVLRYLLSNRVPPPDAEEIVQEVFLLLFQHLRRGKSTANLPGWIFRTAHHYLLRYREKQRRHAERFDPSGSVVEQAACPAARADVLREIAQRQQTIRAVVRALPELDQRCLSLRAEGLRYRDIAAILGVSLGTVANSLQRSLTRIARSED
jgi:RNA polymerase sigma-70 factor (ECF subfamily)